MGASQRVQTMYDMPMWESMERKRLELPKCDDCGTFRYPPSPICADCLSMNYKWTPVSGRGSILSWVVFHRKYFDDHPPPYNSVAVQLDEGPIVTSQLVGEPPQGNWIGTAVELCYEPHEGKLQHAVRVAKQDAR